VYGAGAAWRRRWYTRHPEQQKKLARPVVSVGNIRVGGSGKTPVVEHIARLLLERGERPAILSRGYGRKAAVAGATVVSDGKQVLAGVHEAGDEPLMLARAVPDAIVVVAADRYLSGCLAERRLGATVHILDDGFQHFALARDVELIVVSESDLVDRPFPEGRLRESPEAAAAADAAIVDSDGQEAAERVARALSVAASFRLARAIGPPRLRSGVSASLAAGARVFAAAGIARPERFFDDLRAAGWQVVGALPFPDHHWFRTQDIERIARLAAPAGAEAIFVTAKDAARLERDRFGQLPVLSVPLTATVEPGDRFRPWLFERLR
jgi:tetraacyldisaccharide 4'-kinase